MIKWGNSNSSQKVMSRNLSATMTGLVVGDNMWEVTSAASDTWTSGTNNSLNANFSAGLTSSSSLLDGNQTDSMDGYPYPSNIGWLHIILASIVVTIIIASIVVGNTLVIVAIATDHNLKALQN